MAQQNTTQDDPFPDKHENQHLCRKALLGEGPLLHKYPTKQAAQAESLRRIQPLLSPNRNPGPSE